MWEVPCGSEHVHDTEAQQARSTAPRSRWPSFALFARCGLVCGCRVGVMSAQATWR